MKETLREDMNQENGKIRILITTSAAGMGVNFKGVQNVLNFGPPKDMDTLCKNLGELAEMGIMLWQSCCIMDDSVMDDSVRIEI